MHKPGRQHLRLVCDSFVRHCQDPLRRHLAIDVVVGHKLNPLNQILEVDLLPFRKVPKSFVFVVVFVGPFVKSTMMSAECVCRELRVPKTMRRQGEGGRCGNRKK